MTPKYFIIAIAGLICRFNSFGHVPLDTTAAMNQIAAFLQELNHRFNDPGKSLLKESDLKDFKELDFFPANLNFRIMAEFIKANNSDTIKMKTTTGREPDYLKYAELVFYIHNVKFKLNVYQNIQLSKTEEYKNYLFLPFTDLTNGKRVIWGAVILISLLRREKILYWILISHIILYVPTMIAILVPFLLPKILLTMKLRRE